MPEPHPLRPGEPERLGEYRVLGRLGEGGQGKVYLAEAPGGGQVAIKVLHAASSADETAHRRFVREVEAARRVAAFSTARVLAVSMVGDRPYIVSEYVEGVSLEARVRERGVLGEDELVRLALGTAGALAAIHRAGIVHRDFKPSNVLLGPDGPRVIDFGIARALDSFTVTSSGVVGTPAYMSPEQIANEPAGAAADVFSWAMTMVFAATGRPPFAGTGVPAVLHAILTSAPDLTGAPESLRPLLERCLAKDPAERPSAADIMLHLVGHESATPGTTLTIRPQRGSGRSSWPRWPPRPPSRSAPPCGCGPPGAGDRPPRRSSRRPRPSGWARWASPWTSAAATTAGSTPRRCPASPAPRTSSAPR
ncbi:serine/threonine-protein kinase [Thermocatellispora tengchongensis]|uniref:serine/threonine-protein kinase n=1 Tax=Thermocatellispora tengchongensis TaxID=1073253 RepID=UPI0036319CA1